MNVAPSTRSADKEEASYWQSRPDDTSPSLTLHLGEAGGHVGKVVVSWTRRFAAVYSLEVSADGVSWTRVVSERSGDGGVDTFGLLEQETLHLSLPQPSTPNLAPSTRTPAPKTLNRISKL